MVVVVVVCVCVCVCVCVNNLLLMHFGVISLHMLKQTPRVMFFAFILFFYIWESQYRKLSKSAAESQ